MMVTIFMLSKNIISEQPAEATEEDLLEEVKTAHGKTHPRLTRFCIVKNPGR